MSFKLIVVSFLSLSLSVASSVSVSRSKDVPAFGPPIPKGVTFPKSAVFRDFLLTKAINAENAAHKSDKFRVMATRTRQEYLRDLAENYASSAPLDSSSGGGGAKFSFITLGARRKERSRPRTNGHLQSSGAITWAVVARDNDTNPPVAVGSPVSPGDSSCCLLVISNEFVVLIEEATKEVVFNCYCRDVIGWNTVSPLGRVKIYHERGACLAFSMKDGCGDEVREIANRLEVRRGMLRSSVFVTKGFFLK